MFSHTQSWEGEETHELKEVVSEPTTPPLPKDDNKPDPVSLASYSSHSRTTWNDSILCIYLYTCACVIVYLRQSSLVAQQVDHQALNSNTNLSSAELACGVL